MLIIAVASTGIALLVVARGSTIKIAPVRWCELANMPS
jgi:hypothetical protein